MCAIVEHRPIVPALPRLFLHGKSACLQMQVVYHMVADHHTACLVYAMGWSDLQPHESHTDSLHKIFGVDAGIIMTKLFLELRKQTVAFTVCK